MQIKLIRKSGEKSVVEVMPASEVAFEAKYDMPVGSVRKNTHIYWLAWDADVRALKAEGKTTRLWEDWINDVRDIEVVPDEDPRLDALRAIVAGATNPAELASDALKKLEGTDDADVPTAGDQSQR